MCAYSVNYHDTKYSVKVVNIVWHFTLLGNILQKLSLQKTIRVPWQSQCRDVMHCAFFVSLKADALACKEEIVIDLIG